jgi:ribosomal protein S18 acetylase RimI-like enzyme
MKEEFHIRKARPEDLPVLERFEQGVIAVERPFDVTLDTDINYYDLRKLMTSETSHLVVVEVDGNVIASGYADIRKGNSWNNFTDYAYLGFMYVVPEFRGRGVNRLIVDELVGWANDRGLKEVRLQVYDKNGPAIRAYEKVGFSKLLIEMRLETKSL